MYSRYLILFVIIGFSGLISYGQYQTPLHQKQLFINPELIVQIGAFRNESFAKVLKAKLDDILDKSVIIVAEDGYFKVRITGFSDEEEVEKFYSTLAFLGMKDFWVLPVKKKEEITQQTVVQTDSLVKPESENTVIQDIGEKAPSLSQPVIVLQIDVFHKKSDALNAEKIITTKLNLPVEIVQQWKYYKVFVTGFHTTAEANKSFIDIAQLGFSKISLIENYKRNQMSDSLGVSGR